MHSHRYVCAKSVQTVPITAQGIRHIVHMMDEYPGWIECYAAPDSRSHTAATTLIE